MLDLIGDVLPNNIADFRKFERIGSTPLMVELAALSHFRRTRGNVIELPERVGSRSDSVRR